MKRNWFSSCYFIRIKWKVVNKGPSPQRQLNINLNAMKRFLPITEFSIFSAYVDDMLHLTNQKETIRLLPTDFIKSEFEIRELSPTRFLGINIERKRETRQILTPASLNIQSPWPIRDEKWKYDCKIWNFHFLTYKTSFPLSVNKFKPRTRI